MKGKFYLSCATGALLLSPHVAFAQEAQAGAANGGLEEIVVTAQRKAESAQKAAIAISVVTTDQLQNAGVTSSSALNAVAPSLNVVQSGGATASFFVRGVGNYTNNALSDPAVAFNYDGVYVGRPSSAGTAFFDLERIEVLKGPQGTLYGRNATGGAVNVIPAKPRLGETGGSASLGYGNYDAWDGEAALNLALGDNSAFRVAGKILRRDGFNKDGSADSRGEALRVQYLYSPSSDFDVRLAFDYSHAGGIGPGPSFIGRLDFAPGAPASATAPANYVFVPSGLGAREGVLTPAARAWFAGSVIGGAFNNPAPMDIPPSLDDKNYGVTAELNVDTGIGKLTVQPAYREAKLFDTFNGPSFRSAIAEEKDKQFSLEARLAGNQIGPVEWLIGGYYFDERTRSEAGYNQFVVQSIQSYRIHTESLAGFGRLTFHVADNFRLVAGGRYTHDDKRIDGGAINLLNICTNPPPPAGPGCFGGPSMPTGQTLADIAAAIPPSELPFGFPPAPGDTNARPFGAFGNVLFYIPSPVNDEVKKNRFTYRLAAEYDVGPNSLAYVSYETGYRSGGFGLAIGKTTYGPEYIKSWTLGIKNRLFDNRVQLNVEAFHWKYRDQQVSHFGLNGIGLNDYFTENIGSSTIKGFDVDALFKAGSNTTFNASVQYLDNKLNDFTYQSPRGPTFLPPATSCAVTPGLDSLNREIYNVDCAGKPGFYSPKWAINIGVEQGFDLGPARLTVNAEGRYRSDRVVGFEYLPQQHSGDDFTIDASLKLASNDDRWSVTGWVQNLTNRTIPTNVYLNSTIAGSFTGIYSAPRTYGVRAKVNF